MYGLSVMFGKRLRWPDDYFTFTAALSYQRYVLKDWQYFPVTNGKSNNINPAESRGHWLKALMVRCCESASGSEHLF